MKLLRRYTGQSMTRRRFQFTLWRWFIVWTVLCVCLTLPARMFLGSFAWWLLPAFSGAIAVLGLMLLQAPLFLLLSLRRGSAPAEKDARLESRTEEA